MNNYSLIYSFIYELIQVHSYKKQLLSYLLQLLLLLLQMGFLTFFCCGLFGILLFV